MGHATDDAVQFLASMAEAGRHPQEVTAYADRIAINWHLDAAGCARPERLALLVEELRRWCAVANSHYALRWWGCTALGAPNRQTRPGAGRRRWTRRTGRCGYTSRLKWERGCGRSSYAA